MQINQKYIRDIRPFGTFALKNPLLEDHRFDGRILRLTWFCYFFILNRTGRLKMNPALLLAIETGEPGPFPHAQT